MSEKLREIEKLAACLGEASALVPHLTKPTTGRAADPSVTMLVAKTHE